MTLTHTRRKSNPKSQSEKAESKRSKALERAGDAVLGGDPKKAEKLIAKSEKPKPKKPTASQAVEVLTEAHTIEAQITAMDLKVEAASEHLKSLKAQRETLVGKLRTEIRDMGQGRLPFASGIGKETKKGLVDPKGPKSETKTAKGEAKADASELDGKPELEQTDGRGSEAPARELVA